MIRYGDSGPRRLASTALAALEAARDWRVWRQVFGSEQGLAAGHLHNPSVGRIMSARLGEELDAIAVGAYFGPRADKDGLTMQSSAEENSALQRPRVHE